MFHPGWREHAWSMSERPFDVVVIGGGITGCGILLDAAQRGLRCLLVERGDIASGTSSRSSKLIHGGLRYLKQMQFGITRLACRERDRMLRLSPHLVRPLRFLYPAYRGDRTPGWQIDLGLWMYDHLTARVDKHSQLDREEIASLAPGLVTAGLDRALVYGDAMADDARLTVAVAATAHAYGAAMLTRCTVLGAIRDATGRVTGLEIRDLEDGREGAVTAGVTINATGVWTDQVRHGLGLRGDHLRPSRGAHVILARDRLPISVAVTLLSPDDGRPVFMIPHPEGVLIGTTDIYHDGDLDDPRPTSAEVDYLLRATAVAFPERPVTHADVLGAFAGVRPILDTHADDPSEASREEGIWAEDGVLSVAGGKLTTWRSTAEEAVDAALELLPEERRRRAEPCATKGTPLAGLAPLDLPRRLVRAFAVEPIVAEAMARRLGSLAWPAAQLAGGRRELRPLSDGSDLTAAEVRATLRWGGVLHLDDLLLRRVRIGMWHPQLALGLLPRLRPVVRRELRWSFRRWAGEEERLAAALQGWSIAGIAQ